jgi:sarcosine oxidase
MRIAVVGAGIAGSSSALALAERGHDVHLFDQFVPPHDWGSSHGRSRIVRRAYPDAFYTAYMTEAYPLWRELHERSGRAILYESGLLYFGHRDSAKIRSMIEALCELGVPHETLDQAGAARRMPHLRLDADEVGVFTPEAGWVDADLAVRTTFEMAVSAGVDFQLGYVTDPRKFEESYDAVALCVGAWTTKFAQAPLKVTLQTFAYLDEARHEGPVWIEDGEHGIYGFPSEPSRPQIKFGVHSPGPEIDPADPDRTPVPEKLDLLRDFARRRFGHPEPRLADAKGCLYTSTVSEDFVLGRLSDKTIFASGCSGHGFKFGPWLGRVVADLAEGRKTLACFPRFASAAEAVPAPG